MWIKVATCKMCGKTVRLNKTKSAKYHKNKSKKCTGSSTWRLENFQWKRI